MKKRTAYQEYQHNWYMKNRKRLISKAVKYRKRIQLQRRKEVVEMLGGECQICGYNKNYSALNLHHKDPTKKEHRARGLAWYYFKKHIRKQDFNNILLVCANCHMEIHHPNEKRIIKHKQEMLA